MENSTSAQQQQRQLNDVCVSVRARSLEEKKIRTNNGSRVNGGGEAKMRNQIYYCNELISAEFDAINKGESASEACDEFWIYLPRDLFIGVWVVTVKLYLFCSIVKSL